jgi:GNAT superfamily N-acetyltransferase
MSVQMFISDAARQATTAQITACGPRRDRLGGQPAPEITIRRAAPTDREALEELKEAAIRHLLDPLLTRDQRRTIRRLTPFDPLLIEDGTYYIATIDGRAAASGGWTRRAALVGPMAGRTCPPPELVPEIDPAGIRAMYTHPDYARRGIGRIVLQTAIASARLAGFRRAQLVATPAGERLYRAAGWNTDEHLAIGGEFGAPVPGYRMSRDI